MTDPLVERVLASAKYRGLDPAFVARVVAEVRPTTRSDAEAVKTAKRKLHQAVGAFAVGRPAVALARAEASLRTGDDLRDVLAGAMRAHASTAERVDHLAEVAALLETWVGRPASVVDLACGLGPLATPWLALAEGCAYTACDVDAAVVEGLRSVGPWLPVDLTAEVVDLVGPLDGAAVTAPAELGLVLKAITTLDQQRAGRAAEVLAALRTADVVVSAPTGSLGGGRRYADPLDLIGRTATAAGLEVVADAAIGVERYAHLRRPA